MCYITNYLMAAALGVGFVFVADVQEAHDLRDWEIGVIVAAGFVAALITQLVLAPFADRGKIGVLAWTSVVAGVVGTVGFAFAEQTWTLTASRGLVGIGLGLFSVTARKALIGLDVAGGGAKVGMLLSTGVGGFISGPAFGLAFGTISFAAPFLIVGVAIAIVGPLTVRLLVRAPIAVAEVDYSDVGVLLRRPRVQVAILVQIIVFGFIGIFDATIDRYLTDLGSSDTMTSLVMLAAGLPLLVLPTRFGSLSEQIGGTRVLLPGVLLTLMTMTLFGLAPNPAVVGVVGLFQGVGESATMIAGQVLVLEATGAARVAIGSAILETIGLGAATVTAVVAPIIYGAQGERWLFGGYGALSAVIALMMIIRIRSIKPTTDLEVDWDRSSNGWIGAQIQGPR